MNISFVSDAIYPYNKGGKEKRLYELSTRLASLGHDVHIYTMHWWGTPESIRIEDGVHLHAISRLYPMYKNNRRDIKQGILFGFSCLKLIGVKFEILDVDHMPFFPIYSTWLVCILRGKKLNGTWHEALTRSDWTNYMGVAGNVAALIERISIHLPYTITAASKHTQNLIASELKRTKRIELVSSGIDTEAIKSIKPANIQCDVLYAGRLVKDKNIDKLVLAIEIVAKTDPTVRCTIIGHGVEKAAIEALIIQRKLENQITMLEPRVNASDVYAYMKACKVFCLPSVREGFGIVALESLGCGARVITTNATANAAKDLIVDGVNGSVVSLNPEALAVAICTWISEPRATNLADTVSTYNWDSLAKAQAGIYTL